MKGKIESATNIIVILFAVIVGSVFLKDRLSTPAPEPDAVKAGDKLASLDGWDWAAHDQTLVLGLRKGCHFCEDSAPFYSGSLPSSKEGQTPRLWRSFRTPPMRLKRWCNRKDYESTRWRECLWKD